MVYDIHIYLICTYDCTYMRAYLVVTCRLLCRHNNLQLICADYIYFLLINTGHNYMHGEHVCEANTS